MTIKDQIKEHQNPEDQLLNQNEERESELKRLKEYDNLVIVDYIKSYVDILIGLKIEQSNLERIVSSSRGGDL